MEREKVSNYINRIKGNIKNNSKTVFGVTILLLLILSEIFMYKIDFLRYTDEVVAVFFVVYLGIKLIKKKLKLTKDIKQIIVASIVVITIGLISNIIWRIQENLFAVLVDVLATFKLIICSIGFYVMFTENEAKSIANIFVKPAKMLIILGTIFSVISLFTDIGMGGEKRFGIYAFKFIFAYTHIYAMMIIFCILVIYLSTTIVNKRIIYLFLAIIQMLLTTKGPSLIWAAIVLIFLQYMRHREKINMKLLIVLFLVSVLFGTYQIKNYFLNDKAPRAILYRYSVITSNEYFPLGSGFATYGSDMAAKNYSPLYEEYGFNNIRGMRENQTMFLNDNYWPLILGQFGYIGLFAFLFIAYNFFEIIQKARLRSEIKAIIFSAYFYTMIHSLGSSLLTSSIAIILYSMIVVAFKAGKKEENDIEEKSKGVNSKD